MEETLFFSPKGDRRMKKTQVISMFVLVALLATAGIALAAVVNFKTHLSGDFEVPIRDTLAQGQAVFQLSEDGSELSYKLIASNVQNVFQAHIHMAPAGVNGPIVVWLYPPSPPAVLIPGRHDGVLAEGVITAEDLIGPLAGQSLSALVDAMLADDTYVNVHTNDFVDPSNTGPGDFPGGEIRGQIEGHDH
jgi:hypothetical protein